MPRRLALLGALPAVLLLASCGGGTPGTPDLADPGGRVFANNGCAGCRVLKAAGAQGVRGPSLDHSGGLNLEDVEARVRQGGQGMPRFGARLTDDQITAVAKYVVRVRKG